MNHIVNRKIRQAIADGHITKWSNARDGWCIGFTSTSYPLDLAYMWLFRHDRSIVWIAYQADLDSRYVRKFKEFKERWDHEP